MEIGKQIKSLRLKKGSTQEDMAKFLGVSAQAVSKWENEVTAPDIELLPGLSVYLGVKIDDLFQVPREDKYARIRNMIQNENYPGREEWDSIVEYLKEAVIDYKYDTDAHVLLAGLYCWQARLAGRAAAEYAKQGLAVHPDCRDLHVCLVEAEKGVTGDGYLDNHTELIRYYREFLEKHPNHGFACRILLDQLIADGRFEEAELLLKERKKNGADFRDHIFEGMLKLGKGDGDGALEQMNRAVEQYPDIWQTWCFRGDLLVRLGRQKEAEADYKHCFEMQKAPRLSDGLLALAQIYEEQKDYEKAAAVWETYIQVLKEDYNIVTGETVEQAKRKIADFGKRTVSGK